MPQCNYIYLVCSHRKRWEIFHLARLHTNSMQRNKLGRHKYSTSVRGLQSVVWGGPGRRGRTELLLLAETKMLSDCEQSWSFWMNKQPELHRILLWSGAVYRREELTCKNVLFAFGFKKWTYLHSHFATCLQQWAMEDTTFTVVTVAICGHSELCDTSYYILFIYLSKTTSG